MWNYIAGLGMKVTSYDYNSQNQLTKLEYQSESDTDYKRYIYFYDYAGRMLSVSTEESGPPPDYNYAFAVYKYNENSQVDSVFMNNFNQTLSYSFNNRNWITNCVNSSSIFGYSLDYALNGNVTNQTISGIYRNNFSNTKDVRSNFTYDKSNRLTKIEKYNSKYFDLTGDYSYDPDGNFLTLTRSYNSDNFSYDYYTGTNRLKKVTGLTDHYTYDYNGNQTNDYFAGNTGISYDHRNLITEITRSDNTTDPPTTIKIRYKYDEAGNRTRKTIYRTQDENPSPITNGDNPTGWTITKDEYYSRDASGKEIAVYQSYTLDYWNVWGTGNEGRIKSTGMKYFYLKDHLGSIRAVINQDNVMVQAQDYDPWGHIARSWDSTSADYKFTGKERDLESSYDYFGARYYDSRVGRWGQMEKIDKMFYNYSPYAYSKLNPILYIDELGLNPRVYIVGSTVHIETVFYYIPYSKDNVHGLDRNEIKDLTCVIRNMNKWSGNFIVDGKEYSVVVEAKIREGSGEDYNNMASGIVMENLDNNKGYSFIEHVDKLSTDDVNNRGIGIALFGNVLEISDRFNPYLTTGAHEFGHMFGLTHSDVRVSNGVNSIMGKVNIDIEKKFQHRNLPDADDRKLLYDNLLKNFNLK